MRAQDGRWFTVRVLPYRTIDDRIEGVVITFSDVSRLNEAENRLQYEKDYAEASSRRSAILWLCLRQ